MGVTSGMRALKGVDGDHEDGTTRTRPAPHQADHQHEDQGGSIEGHEGRHRRCEGVEGGDHEGGKGVVGG